MGIDEFLVRKLWQVAALAMLLAAQAFFNACESALFSLSGGELYVMSKDPKPLRRLVAALMKNPRAVLTTILLSNTLLTIMFFTTSTLLLVQVEHTVRHGHLWSSVLAVSTLLAVVTVGEVVPKSLGYLWARRWSELVAPVFALLTRLVQPLHRLLMILVIGPLTKLVAPARARRADLAAEEMEALLNLSQRRGLIGQDQSELIQEVLELTDLKAGDIMVPRVDMVAVDAASSNEELIELIRQRRVMKVPVYQGDIDHVLGVLYAKHLLVNPGAPVKELLTPVQNIPETAPLERVLLQLRATRSQVGIVVDEYGGTAGMITLQDVLEEIVGDIADINEPRQAPSVQQVGPAEWLVEGDLPVHEWAQAFPTEISTARYTTVGGFVLSLFGSIPRVGQSVRYHNITFTVEAMRRRRVSLLRVRLRERRT